MLELIKRINWLYLLAYSLLAGGIVTLSIYLAVETPLDAELALPIMFGLLGTSAYGFSAIASGRGWKWLAYLNWAVAGFLAWLALMVEGWLDPAIGLAGMFFAMAAVVMAFAMRRRAVSPERAEGSVREWRALGTGSEREWAMQKQDERERVIARDR